MGIIKKLEAANITAERIALKPATADFRDLWKGIPVQKIVNRGK